jgi:hypothetical protein
MKAESRLPAALLLSVVSLIFLSGCLFLRLHPSASGPAAADPRARTEVEATVRALSGPRNVDHPAAYRRAADWIEAAWVDQGYTVTREAVMGDVPNLIVELPGVEPPGADLPGAEAPGGRGVVLLGAHYDSCMGAPGADDNASGVAAMLEVSRRLAGQRLPLTVRFVAYANEEPPWFQGPGMGSPVNAAAAALRGDRLEAVIVLDAVGYFDDRPGSQRWPLGLSLLLHDRADFIAVVADTGSARMMRRVTAELRRQGGLPTLGAAIPAFVTGVDWSDHWSYWQEGYEAVLVTDMPPFRNPHYHEPTDTPDKLDYDRLAALSLALSGTISSLAGGPGNF